MQAMGSVVCANALLALSCTFCAGTSQLNHAKAGRSVILLAWKHAIIEYQIEAMAGKKEN